MSAEYKTEQVELKYIEFKTPWNIFEKHRGKRVFNVPNDLSVCIDNPSLVLESELTAAQAEIARLQSALDVAVEGLGFFATDGFYKMTDFITASPVTEVGKMPENIKVHGNPVLTLGLKKATETLDKIKQIKDSTQ